MNILLQFFNLSWTLHFFPSIWRIFSIIPIHKIGKPLDSPAYQSFLNALFYLVYSSFWSLISFSLPARPVSSWTATLNQILFLSQSISDKVNKLRSGSRTILATIDFSKAFDSVWHSALFHKLISAGLSFFFALAYLPTALSLSVALSPLLSFQQAQYAQVPQKLRHSASFCSTNKSATFSHLTLALSLPPCPLLHLFFYFKLSGRNCLLSPSVLSGYSGSLDTRFSQRMTRLMCWPNGDATFSFCNPL